MIWPGNDFPAFDLLPVFMPLSRESHDVLLEINEAAPFVLGAASVTDVSLATAEAAPG
jgi:hypothetical protein